MAERKGAKTGLEINEDMVFQEKNWFVQRVAWIIMGILLLGAALGLFAGGPVSWTEKRSERGLMSIEYSRFQRQDSDWEMNFHISPAATAAEEVAIDFDAAFLQGFEFRTVSPEPSRSVARQGGVQLHFAVAAGEPAAIAIQARPKEIGIVKPKVSVAGAEPLELFIVVYP